MPGSAGGLRTRRHSGILPPISSTGIAQPRPGIAANAREAIPLPQYAPIRKAAAFLLFSAVLHGSSTSIFSDLSYAEKAFRRQTSVDRISIGNFSLQLRGLIIYNSTVSTKFH